MDFIRLILAETGRGRVQLVVFTTLAGIGSAVILAIVNTVADPAGHGGVNYELLAFYVLCCVVVLAAQARALLLTTKASEKLVERLRARLTGLIIKADLDAVETLGPARIYGNIARNTATLSEAASTIIYGATSAIALVLAAVYIAIYSLLAFLVIVMLFSATMFFYRHSQRRTWAHLERAQQAEATFFDTLNHLLLGFKETKLSAARAGDLARHLYARSEETARLKVEATIHMNAGLNVAHASFYTLLAAIVFALPQYLDSTATAMKLTYTTVYMLSTIEVVMKAIPMLTRANVAMQQLAEMEAQLVAATRAEEPPPALATPSFRRIELQGVSYTYTGPDGRPTFTVGPCDMSLEPGELVFIVGGNGSGKSTLLRLLTYLYEPQSGVILWDGPRVDRSNAADYRNLFSAVFADFHLFDRLYGMPGIEPARAQELLQTMGLAGKTEYRDGRFTNLDLSTGQRKRLAFVIALLEDKPIYALDELAADQDSTFRRRYYEELLPALKARGKGVLVISHDERYFHLADRVLVMEDGRFVQGGWPR
jgi:putative ATP-binding cassette transporter